MSPEQTFQLIPIDALLDKVRDLKNNGWRLVQIGATRLPEQIELTYSFDLHGLLANFRLHLPAAEAVVPSISSIYWAAFLYENEMHDLFKVTVNGMAVDFHGNLYKTTIPFPFGSTKPPVVKTAAPPRPLAEPAVVAG